MPLVVVRLADHVLGAQLPRPPFHPSSTTSASAGLPLASLHGCPPRSRQPRLLPSSSSSETGSQEGIGVGVSYGGGETLGVFITTAIAVHNIPEGLAISLVLVPRGVGVLGAAGWSVFSSLPQPALAVPAFIFVTFFEPLLPLGLGLAAGAMIWMALAELLPDALQEASPATISSTVLVAVGAMLAFQQFLRT